MKALIFFAIWAAVIFLMMRFGCGSHVLGHGRRDADGDPAGNRNLRWIPPPTAVDPVCNKTVEPEKAKPSVYDGYVFYFCSRECREVFEAAPELYVDGRNDDQRKLEHSHA